MSLARGHPLKEEAAAAEVASSVALPAQRRACGWIGWKTVKRERKRTDPWIGQQAWLYWEEPGGKKRSRYIPKSKLAEVEQSVYHLRRSVQETLAVLDSPHDRRK